MDVNYILEYIYDNEVNDADDFSLFFKYTDSNKLPVSILPNEFVFGELNEGKTDTYNITIQKDINNVDFILECDFCKVKINNVQYSGLDKLYKYESTGSLKGQTLNIEISPNTSLTYPQFYSFKLIVPDDYRRITSENIEYCDSTSCLFAIPIKNYESTNKVSFYVTNNEYPKTFEPTIKGKLVDFDVIESNQELDELTDITGSNNFYSQSIESSDKDKYLVLKLESIKDGQIALITGKYPHFSNRNIIPNSGYLIHSENDNIEFNLYGNTLQFTGFININNGGTISNYLDYDDESISESNFEHNIIPSDKSFNYNGGENSDILLRYKSSPNNTLNIHLDTNLFHLLLL